MPSYLSSGRLGLMNRSGGCCDDNSIDRNSAIFFNNLASKLLEMTHSFEKRIEDIKKNCGGQSARGFLFASIDTPQMNISIGSEYVIYVQRFGPPEKGKFDKCKLDIIRKELKLTAPPEHHV
jgi:hypothetical protein